jgi:hypothetical protein
LERKIAVDTRRRNVGMQRDEWEQKRTEQRVIKCAVE